MKTTQLANMILQKSFNSKNYINSMQLQKMLFLVAREYFNKNSEKVITENFLAWPYGPVLSSVHEYYESLNGKTIKKYMKDHTNAAFVVDDEKVQKIINEIWNNTYHLSPKEVSELTRVKGSGWYEAFQKDSEIIAF